jgi:hypothetical protein
MRSASLIVLSRCATRTTVLPARAVRRLSWIARSVAVSRWLVASSKMRTSGLLSNARAIASRCRWPPEKLAPRSPTRVSYRSGSPEMNSSRPEARAAAMTSSRVASGRPSAMFSWIVPLKTKGSWETTPIRARSVSSS